MKCTTRRGFLAALLTAVGGGLLAGCSKTKPVIDTTTPIMSEKEAAQEKEPRELADDEEQGEGDEPIMEEDNGEDEQ